MKGEEREKGDGGGRRDGKPSVLAPALRQYQ